MKIVIDEAKCAACGTCYDSCGYNAVNYEANKVPTINIEKCVGCGVCTLTCPTRAAHREKTI